MREGTLIFTGDKALTKKKRKRKEKAAIFILNRIREYFEEMQGFI